MPSDDGGLSPHSVSTRKEQIPPGQHEAPIEDNDSNNGPSAHLLAMEATQDSPPLPHDPPSSPAVQQREGPVSWSSLPHKGQLAVLTFARLSEPLVQTSLQSYMFFQLRSFDPSLSDAVIASQAGIMQSSFTAAQFLTAMMWGRISDSDWGGRKMVLMIGLLGTLFSCIGFGFSKSFWQAIIFRTLGGVLNGNVGVIRTMISEIIQEKRYQSRAFLILPMCFNVGVIVGPVVGGVLADPASSYPSLFGGVEWLKKYPYALPNLLSAFLLLMAATAVFFGLEETLESIRHKGDLGTKCRHKVLEIVDRLRGKESNLDHTYTAVNSDESDALIGDHSRDGSEDIELGAAEVIRSTTRKRVAARYRNKLPFRKIFTRNVVCVLIAHAILAMHIGTFNNLWFVFLSTPVTDPSNPHTPDHRRQLPFKFNGGLGLTSSKVGLALAILGSIGIILQLFIYPRVNTRLGTVPSWRISLYCFPVAYLLAPFLSIVPSRSPPPATKDGFWIWLAIMGVLVVQVVGRTFALPGMQILINNSSPHPSVLGTVHGVAQSVSSAARTLGPVVFSSIYGVGLDVGVVGLSWWILSGVAVLAVVASGWVVEGNGHEIRIEGDDEAEAEADELNEDLQ